MAGRTLGAALAFLLLATAPAFAAAGWSQSGGDGHRSGEATIPDPPDVIGFVHFLPPGFDLVDSGLVAAPAGVFGLASTGTAQAASCTLFVLRPGQAQSEPLGSPFGCGSVRPGFGGDLPALQAYDVASNEVVACLHSDSGQDVLRGFDVKDGGQTWTASVPNSVPGQPWFCQGVAVDQEHRIAYVPLVSNAGTEGISVDCLVAAWDLAAHRWLWATRPYLENPNDLGLSGAQFLPSSATVTDTGVEVLGVFSQTSPGRGGSALVSQDIPAVVGFDPSGGEQTALVGPQPTSTVPAAEDGPSILAIHSTQAAGRRNQATFLLADELYRADPAGNYQVVYLPDYAMKGLGLASYGPTSWAGRYIAAQVSDRVEVFDSDQMRYVGELQTGGQLPFDAAWSPGAGYVALAGDNLRAQQSWLWRFDLGRMLTLQAIPLSIAANYLLPLGNGTMLAWDNAQGRGVAAVLGKATHPGLSLAAMDAYPPLDVAAAVPTAGAGLKDIEVSWGDGSVEPVLPGASAQHRYSVASDVPLSVTVVFADNTTATTQRILHVGQPRPPDLNAIQVAFSDKNQNLTFGILGLALTLIGFLVAVIARGRRRSRVAAELEVLEGIRQKGRIDAAAAFADVAAFRLRLKDDLAKGHLDDSQFSALELDVRDLMAVLRERVLGVSLRGLSQGFAHAFEVAVLDGRLEASERDTLLAQLGREAIPVAERGRLQRIIEGWPA